MQAVEVVIAVKAVKAMQVIEIGGLVDGKGGGECRVSGEVKFVGDNGGNRNYGNGGRKKIEPGVILPLYVT